MKKKSLFTVKKDFSHDYINTKNIKFDKIIISKVFTFSKFDENFLNILDESGNNIVEYEGTGFYYDKAPALDECIEHCFPDYHLYDSWVQKMLNTGSCKKNELKYFTDFSIGFTTRGCIRQCSFCVNKNYKKCSVHSELNEFLDLERPYICLLDDNVFACQDWKEIFKSLNNSGKKFQFRQGLDERLLTEEKCEVLFNSNYYEHKIFAFDNIKDWNLIKSKLELIRNYSNEELRFYCFCAFPHNGESINEKFWVSDIIDLFKRIALLMNYNAIPYIMRHENYMSAPDRYRGTYINIAAWCNQIHLFEKLSYKEYCLKCQERSASNTICSTYRYYTELLDSNSKLENFFNLKKENSEKFLKILENT